MVLEISKISLRTENWNEKNETSASKMNHSVIACHVKSEVISMPLIGFL